MYLVIIASQNCEVRSAAPCMKAMNFLVLTTTDVDNSRTLYFGVTCFVCCLCSSSRSSLTEKRTLQPLVQPEPVLLCPHRLQTAYPGYYTLPSLQYLKYYNYGIVFIRQPVNFYTRCLLKHASCKNIFPFQKRYIFVPFYKCLEDLTNLTYCKHIKDFLLSSKI